MHVDTDDDADDSNAGEYGYQEKEDPDKKVDVTSISL